MSSRKCTFIGKIE